MSPKLSIITVVYNNETTIADTIRSVAMQSYKNIEYIIVDGQSTDGTLQHIAEHWGTVTHLISEKDKGIYDAMNKGLALATGDVVGFINGDDFYAGDVLGNVAYVFDDDSIDVCYGDLCYVRQDDPSVVIRYWRSSDYKPGSFAHGWCPPHPSFFARRSLFTRYGGFDLDFRIAGDFELILRFMEKNHAKSKYLPGVLVNMRLGGVSNRSIGNIIKQNHEILRALNKNGVPINILNLFAHKLIDKGIQFFVKPSS